jgi:hypothetical protein
MTFPATLCREEFTQTDPLSADVGSLYPSAYIYANSSPLRFVDPSGRRSVGAQSGLDTAGVPTILAFARTGLSCSTGGGSPYQDDAGVPIPNSGATKCGSWGHRINTFRGEGRPDIDLARMGQRLRNLLRKSGWKPRVFGGCIDGQVDFVNLQLSAQGCWGRTSAGTFGATTVTVPTTAAAGISAIGSAGVFATNAHHARDLNGWGVCVSVVAGDGLGGVGVGCGSLGWVTYFEKGSSHREYEDFNFTGTYFAYIGVGVGGGLSGGASLTWTTTYTLGWT